MTTQVLSRALLAHFGSTRTTLVCMGLLGAAALAGQVQESLLAVALGLALALLSLNLLAALVVHPTLRRQLPLLVFHLALLAIVLLAGLGRLTALDGHVELTQGTPFEGRLIESSAGRWHRDGLAQLAFTNDGFEIDYAPGRQRGATRNRVSWQDADGNARSAVIGDHRPLVLDGYRIYTSYNKGFAPVLTWRAQLGPAITGAVHLPSFPSNELHQSREWSLPDGRAVWVLLQTDETLIDPAAQTTFRLPQSHWLVLRMGDTRAELRPGQSIALPGGTLVYEGLRSWMGYRVTYDPTMAWMLAASLLAACALAWHYTQRFFFGTAAQKQGRAALRGAADV